MMKMFLGKEFEFGGTLQNLDQSKGNYPGVYLIVRPDNFGEVCFEAKSQLSTYRGRGVSVPICELQTKWVENAKILYIGRRITNTVYSRVKKHIKFYEGQHVSAYGGRVIGQIKDWQSLEVWYLLCDPAKTEKELLNAFKDQYGKLPFANWKN